MWDSFFHPFYHKMLATVLGMRCSGMLEDKIKNWEMVDISVNQESIIIANVQLAECLTYTYLEEIEEGQDRSISAPLL